MVATLHGTHVSADRVVQVIRLLDHESVCRTSKLLVQCYRSRLKLEEQEQK